MNKRNENGNYRRKTPFDWGHPVIRLCPLNQTFFLDLEVKCMLH